MLLPLGILASSGGAAAADYELITTTLVPSSQASVTFNSSAAWANYKHFQLRMVSVNSADVNRIRFNGDTGSNYANHYLRGNGSTATSASATTAQQIQLSTILASNNTYAAVIDILDPLVTTKNKTVRTLIADSNQGIELNSGLWLSTSAVTSIEVSVFAGTINAGSRFSLYGLKG